MVLCYNYALIFGVIQKFLLTRFMHNIEKWQKHILKILRCEHHKIIKVCLAIF